MLDIVIEGDRAAGVWRTSGRRSDLWGMAPADGTRIELHGIDYFRLDGDKIIGTRHVEDRLGVVTGLGGFGG